MSWTPPTPQPLKIDWEGIRIGSPCDMSWDTMSGDDRCRFCRSCRKNVFNLADLGREEAEATILEHEGRLCVRLYRRHDGTLVTGDCLETRQHLRRVRRLVAGAAALFLTFGSVALAGNAISSVTPESELAAHGTFARKVQDTILDVRVKLGIDPEPIEFIMGEIYIPCDEDSGSTG